MVLLTDIIWQIHFEGAIDNERVPIPITFPGEFEPWYQISDGLLR
jgi:hypothetical protein